MIICSMNHEQHAYDSWQQLYTMQSARRRGAKGRLLIRAYCMHIIRVGKRGTVASTVHMTLDVSNPIAGQI